MRSRRAGKHFRNRRSVARELGIPPRGPRGCRDPSSGLNIVVPETNKRIIIQEIVKPENKIIAEIKSEFSPVNKVISENKSKIRIVSDILTNLDIDIYDPSSGSTRSILSLKSKLEIELILLDLEKLYENTYKRAFAPLDPPNPIIDFYSDFGSLFGLL